MIPAEKPSVVEKIDVVSDEGPYPGEHTEQSDWQQGVPDTFAGPQTVPYGRKSCVEATL